MKIDLTPKQKHHLFRAIDEHCINTQDEKKPTVEELQSEVKILMTQLAEAEDLKHAWFFSKRDEFCARAMRLGIITVSEAEAPWNVAEFVDLLLTKLEGGSYTPDTF